MNNRGFALVNVVVALIIISLVALLFTNLISIESNIAMDKFFSTKAYYSAQSGIENAQRILSLNYNWYYMQEGILESRSDNLDGASYITNVYLPATALKKDINKNKTTIDVFDTSRFPSSNILLLINSEQILCSGKTSSTFTNCQRGYNGTTKDKHDAGSFVFQVATLISVDNAKRTITVNNNEKFITSGLLLIDSDPTFPDPVEVTYTDKSNNIFWGCDDLSWYTPGTYYVINSGLDLREQIEIISEGRYKGIVKKINSTIFR
ncbi:MAG: pilus assembly PilX N-terminal domain-containing protein [Proteobacteria bacterium]|nr:pilus assembly PilX N-terminal domain-containing protein [Pseudomonadota bacterium]